MELDSCSELGCCGARTRLVLRNSSCVSHIRASVYSTEREGLEPPGYFFT
jgi:hypothetical protein